MKNIFFIALLLIAVAKEEAVAQGCVAIRSNGNSCATHIAGKDKGYQLTINSRYFKSYKHFVGTAEQKQRVEEGTEVINHSLSTDFTLTKTFNKFWSAAFNLPIISNTRSSLYEHGGNSLGPSARHKTKSFGIGDMRLTVYRWLLNPDKATKGNIQAGLGIKLPTGDYRVEDYFYKADGTTVMGPVDQSIQLGDGGTGISAELNGYYNLSYKLGFYGNLYYLVNPREQNGVSTARGGAVSALAVKYFFNTMSVPDQYLARGGVSYRVNAFTFSGGLRWEGIPSSDLIGGSRGFRRPGYVISAEPVVAYMTKKINLYLAVPVALQRNRTQSYSDKLRSADAGTKIHGDAAFADYAINVGATFLF
jgi:hypothetical protein